MRLTARERIGAVLRGDQADGVPFTVYHRMLHRGDAERRLRNEGVAPVERIYIYRVEMPHVEVTYRDEYEGGLRTVRERVRAHRWARSSGPSNSIRTTVAGGRM